MRLKNLPRFLDHEHSWSNALKELSAQNGSGSKGYMAKIHLHSARMSTTPRLQHPFSLLRGPNVFQLTCGRACDQVSLTEETTTNLHGVHDQTRLISS